MANITRVTVTTVPRTSGVPNATIDAINDALTQHDIGLAEINLSGGDAMGDRVPSAAALVRIPNIIAKFGEVSITAAKLTEAATAGFTITGLLHGQSLDQATAGAQFVATTSAATAITVTFTRGTSAAADIIYYAFFGAA